MKNESNCPLCQPKSKIWQKHLSENIMLDVRSDVSGIDSGWIRFSLGKKAIEEGLVEYSSIGKKSPLNCDIEEVIKALTDLGGYLQYSTGGVSRCDRYTPRQEYCIVWPLACATISCSSERHSSYSINVLNKELFESILEILESSRVEEEEGGKMSVLVQGNGSLYLEEIQATSVPFEAENYAENVVADFRHVCEDLKSKKPCGRLTILEGCPGTGKTHMVRSINAEVPDATFVIVPQNLVSQLDSPSLLGTLITASNENNGKSIVLIVEDADSCLVKRGADSMGALASILNLSDGIIGRMLDLRIICTSNAAVQDLDNALMRDGRLCRHIEVGLLDGAHANKVFQRLTGKEGSFEAKGFYSLAQIYKASNGGDVGEKSAGQKPRNVVGFRL